MKQKTSKQKVQQQTIYLFEDRNDLLFFYYDHNHPKRIDLQQFYIGKFKLYRQNKAYTAQLTNKILKNTSVNWNADTFQMMINKLNDFIIEQDNIDFSECLFITVYIKIKGKSINLLKVKLTESFGIDVTNELWNQFRKYNNFKTKYWDQTIKSIANLQSQIQTSYNSLQKLQQSQISKIQQIKKKLSALMYEKQKKIKQLTNNPLYQWTPDQQNNQKQSKNNYKNTQQSQFSQQNFISSQADHDLIGSLFAPSQDFQI